MLDVDFYRGGRGESDGGRCGGRGVSGFNSLVICFQKCLNETVLAGHNCSDLCSEQQRV